MKPPKRKAHKLMSSGEVLQSLLKNSKEPIGQQFEQLRLLQAWPEVVGATIAKHSKPVGIFKGVLYIYVDSAPRMQDFTFAVKAIKEQINAFFGKVMVRRIQFSLDARAVPVVKPE